MVQYDHARTHYRLCLRCARAVPAQSLERYCINDGTMMLEFCPVCETRIHDPYARCCAGCGLAFSVLDLSEPEKPQFVLKGKN